MTTPDVAELARGLTDLERELLLGTSPHWGSWMFMVGGDLVQKGLGRKHDGNLSFDTPLAKSVIAYLSQPPKTIGEER